MVWQGGPTGSRSGASGPRARSPFGPAAGSGFDDAPSPFGGFVPTASERAQLRAAELISQALDARARSDQMRADIVIDELVTLQRAQTGRDVIIRDVHAQLRSAVTGVWRRGWLPADVHRLARRELTEPEQELIADAMVEELEQYAPTTIDPRWPAQLEDIEARRWWPSDRTFLTERQRRHDAFDVWHQVIGVLGLLLRLPTIERLAPVPGTARAHPVGHARGRRAHVAQGARAAGQGRGHRVPG